MSTAVLGVGHTGITVSDLERASGFFRDVLGATVTEPVSYASPVFARITGVDGASIRIVYADLPGHRIELLEYVKPDDRKTSCLRPCDSGHMHLCLLVEDIEHHAERFRAAGFAPVGPVQETRKGGTKAVYTIGFDNLVIELMQSPALRR
jgi:catechol 2,3-dioxygenase-like lactoylglutathione lyase family enzyme